MTAQKASMKNWERIRSNNANKLLISSREGAKSHLLDRSQRIKSCLEQNDMLQYFMEMTLPYTTNIHRKLYLRLIDEFHQNSFADINHPNSKLRTYGQLKATVGLEDYLTAIRNTKYRNHLTTFQLSNHKLMIEDGRHQKLPKNSTLLHLLSTTCGR